MKQFARSHPAGSCGNGPVSLTPGSLVEVGGLESWLRTVMLYTAPGKSGRANILAMPGPLGRGYRPSGALGKSRTPLTCQGKEESCPSSRALQDLRKSLGQEQEAEEGGRG